MKKIYAFVLACLYASLTSFSLAEETNVTSKYLKNPSFENKFTGWTQTNMQTQTNTSFTLKAGTTYVEKWVSQGSRVGTAAVYQTLSKLPAGQYRLQAVAQNIQQGSATTKQTGAVLYAGSEKTTVNVTDTYSVEFTTLGESIEVGFKATNASGNWLCVDDFKLFFIGEDIAKLLEALQTQVEAAQKTLDYANRTTPARMQQSYMETLTKAIEDAQKLDETATAEQIGQMAVILDKANSEGYDNYLAMTALNTLVTRAKTYTSETKKMAESYKQTLLSAYEAAQAVLALETDADITKTTETLQKAYDDAVESNTAYIALNKAISAADVLNTDGKEGADELAEAIEAAKAVLAKADATPAEMDEATAEMEKATLIYRVANGTGKGVTVKTDGIVQGATEIFGRATFGSGTTKEKGFCYSTDNPEPTIYDNRTTFSYSNNGTIYALQNLKPATLYYIRAYAISNGYMVSYGDVVKTYTRPLGNATFSYGNEGDEATNNRIRSACEEGVWMWNNISGIKGFHLDAHYVPGAGAGDGTADCSYGGYMRVSQNTAYQKTGTILHEGAHGQGMVPYTDWTNSIYRTNGDRGDWLGPRVDRVIQFLDNNPSAKLHGDHQHMWPYGINGAGEDNGSPMLYRANALLVGALAEDGIRTPNQDFLKPAYSFTQDDEAKYYIKSADQKFGLTTSYLVEATNGQLRWEAMTSDEAFQNDSCAWTITFNPSTCYYQFQNVATGRWMSYSATGKNGIRTVLSAGNNSRFHLLSARAATTVNKFTFESNAYWVVAPNSLACLNALADGAISAVAFNHSDNSTAQRWLLLTADEVARFGEANGETVGVRSLDMAQQGSLRVLGGQGVVSVTAIGAGSEVTIHSLDGRLLRQLYVQQDASALVRLPRGIYLVGDQKVMVR